MRIEENLAGIAPQVAAINLEPIAVKAMMEYRMDLPTALAGVRELRRFYMLVRMYRDRALSPSAMMDQFWHLHILDTQKYGPDCDVMFGRFLHHFPYLGLRGVEDEALLKATADATRMLYREVFGEEMPGGNGNTVCGAGCNSHPELLATICGTECGTDSPAVEFKEHTSIRPTLEAYIPSSKCAAGLGTQALQA